VGHRATHHDPRSPIPDTELEGSLLIVRVSGILLRIGWFFGMFVFCAAVRRVFYGGGSLP
jgi:hypothetical protein